MSDEQKKAGWMQTILIGRNPVWTLVRVLALVVVCTVVFRYILLPIRIQGSSMSPTYRDGRIGLVNRLAYASRAPERGDVVSIRTSSTSLMLLKRIVGLPGETVEFIEGRLHVNGKPVDEPYLKSPNHWEMSARTLGPDEYFVVGDNRGVSDFGGVPRERIVGKVLF